MAKYNSQYHDDWAFSLALHGATDQDIADAFHVNRKTINRWSYEWDENGKKKLDSNGEPIFTSFGEALFKGKNIADAKVEASLYKRCIGYDTEDEQKIIDVNRDGTSKIGQIRSTKKYIPPDTMAIMYWLNNRSRRTGEWSQRQDVNVSFGDDSIRDAVRELTLDEARAKLAAIRAEKDEE